jgi:hypothetical protein
MDYTCGGSAVYSFAWSDSIAFVRRETDRLMCFGSAWSPEFASKVTNIKRDVGERIYFQNRDEEKDTIVKKS